MNPLCPVEYDKVIKTSETLHVQNGSRLPREEFPLNGNLRAISALSDSLVWVSGSEGHVYKTIDGGFNWQSCRIPNSLDFRSLHAFDLNNACAASAGLSNEGQAIVYRTEDGGRSWREVLNIQEKGYFISGMKFWDDDNGIILCDPVNNIFQVYLTDNGGRTWKLQAENPQLQNYQNEAIFAASNTSLSVYKDSEIWFTTGVSKARVFYSSDRGRTWEVFDTPVKCKGQISGLFSIAFLDSNEGIAVGGEYGSQEGQSCIITTKNGGRTWNVRTTDQFSNECLFCVAWNNSIPVMIEGSSRTFHSAVCTSTKIWMAGPGKVACAKRSLL